MPRWDLGLVLLLVAAAGVEAASSEPIQVAPGGGTVWVVNPDSGTVARLDPATATRTGEFAVGRSPRTLAVTAGAVYVANQGDDSVTRLAPDGTVVRTRELEPGCAPYGVVEAGGSVYVSCQGTSELLVLDANLDPVRTVPLAWPEARALAVGPDGAVYVTHYITKEPNNAGHVSVVDPQAGTVTRVIAIEPDVTTCETQGSGQGVANLLTAIGIPPGPGARLWVGGTLHASFRKGLFERSRYFRDRPGIGLFPALDFQANPAGEATFARRNIYKPAAHDVARAGIWTIDLTNPAAQIRLDVAGGAAVSGLAFSPAGDVAYAVDLIANAFYVFSTARGVGGNAAGLFGPVSAGGPGGADPTAACRGAADATVSETPFILAPQARLVPTGGMEPRDDTPGHATVDTGLEFTIGTGAMRGVPDGVGTTPIGVALAADGSEAYVANYLARNVAIVHATASGFGCLGAPAAPCATRLDCAGGAECMPLVRAVVPTIADTSDPLPAEILDGKILFTTSARDAAGAGSPIPPFNRLTRDGLTPQGAVTSTARDGASLACTSCHPDFGGNDGRTWDFSQFGSSLRNTMDLRGRAGFAPGHCSHDGAVACTTDVACRAGGPSARCLGNPTFTPPNIGAADQANFFNPMGSTHWNGDRDEVEDFEFTFRELLGASDCDGNEDKTETCVGALVVRRFVTTPADVRVDLSPQPNRHRSARLDHLADYVYSLTAFPRNPNLGADGASPSAAAARGRLLFNDPVVHCSFCHNSVLGATQQFTDKQRNRGYDPGQTPRADLNSPYLRHDVGTTNVFDQTNPFAIANDQFGLVGFTLFQNEQNMIPGNRSVLNNYLTPVLNDVWNTAPYLHDGSAPTLLDVVRPCLTQLEACDQAGKGRNVDDQHGGTSFLSARQLNDLVAFQKAPHAPIGEVHALDGVRLELRRVRVRFGKPAGRDALMLVGGAKLPQSLALDPAAVAVTVSVGVPAGERMAVVERTVAAGELRTNRARTTFRFADPRGTRHAGLRSLVLTVRNGQLGVRLAAAGLDLSSLRAASPDYTVGIEIGGTTVGVSRRLRKNRRGTIVHWP